MAQEITFINMPVNGSLAYDFTNTAAFPEREWGRVREEERKVVIPAPPETEERTQALPRVRTRQSVAPGALIGFACAAVLLVFSLMARIQLTAVTNDAVALESSLAELETEQARLLIAYESAFNLAEIEGYATSVLGMQRPREEQVIYLNSSVPDKAVVLGPDEQKGGLLDRIYGMLEFIGEYFK